MYIYSYRQGTHNIHSAMVNFRPNEGGSRIDLEGQFLA